MKHKGNFYAKTDVGRVRVSNEDQVFVGMNKHSNVLLAVADGMGGHARGDLASKLAMQSLVKGFQSTLGLLTSKTATLWLRSQIIEANRTIYKEAQRSSSLKEMGTTLVLALIVHKQLILLNIGDSRVYSLFEGTLTCLTQDQTYVDYLYRQGKITLEDMKIHPQRHVLLNALGLNTSVSYDLNVIPYEGQTLLVCSDGLYNNVSTGEMTAILTSSDSTQQKVEAFIRLANAHGGTDNIAVGLWEPL
jgi:PPM family protein phosphatase